MRNTMGWITGVALCGFAISTATAETIGPQFDDATFLSQVSCLSDCSSCSATDGCSAGCSGGDCGCCGSKIDVGGWLAWGWYGNDHGLRQQNGNAPLGFNNVAGEPVLHQAWTYLGKEAETGNGIDWGFRCDFMFGADGPDTSAFGDGSWDTSWTTSSQYGFAMPQLYGEVALGETLVKFGHFYTIIGYQVVQAPDNFFYSHPYTMYYNEPFTHTGFLAQRGIGDDITVYGGWTAGWDTGFDNRNDGSVFLGGIGVQLTEKISVIYATTFGDPGDDPNLATDVYMHSLVFDTAITEKLNWVFQSDYQTRTPDPANGASFKQYGIVNFLMHQTTEKLGIGLRHEWFYAGENAPVAPLGLAVSPGTHYQAFTVGMNFRPKDNIIIKPELRADYVDFDGAVAGGPFDQGTRRSQMTGGIQSIFTF